MGGGGQGVQVGADVGCVLILCIAVVVRMTIDPRSLTLPGRSASGFNRPGRHRVHQGRSAARRSVSGMGGELHPTKNRGWGLGLEVGVVGGVGVGGGGRGCQ